MKQFMVIAAFSIGCLASLDAYQRQPNRPRADTKQSQPPPIETTTTTVPIQQASPTPDQPTASSDANQTRGLWRIFLERIVDPVTWFTFFLFVVAVRQWHVMNRQADLMRDALSETQKMTTAASDSAKAAIDGSETAAKQVEAAKRQVETMERQAREMQAQTHHMGRSEDIAQHAAAAMYSAAQAAQQSAANAAKHIQLLSAQHVVIRDWKLNCSELRVPDGFHIDFGFRVQNPTSRALTLARVEIAFMGPSQTAAIERPITLVPDEMSGLIWATYVVRPEEESDYCSGKLIVQLVVNASYRQLLDTAGRAANSHTGLHRFRCSDSGEWEWLGLAEMRADRVTPTTAGQDQPKT